MERSVNGTSKLTLVTLIQPPTSISWGDIRVVIEALGLEDGPPIVQLTCARRGRDDRGAIVYGSPYTGALLVDVYVRNDTPIRLTHTDSTDMRLYAVTGAGSQVWDAEGRDLTTLSEAHGMVRGWLAGRDLPRGIGGHTGVPSWYDPEE